MCRHLKLGKSFYNFVMTQVGYLDAIGKLCSAFYAYDNKHSNLNKPATLKDFKAILDLKAFDDYMAIHDVNHEAWPLLKDAWKQYKRRY